MLEIRYIPIFDDNNVIIKNIMTLRFNGKLCNAIEFPAEISMTQDECDSYLAGKLSGILY